MKVLLFRIDHIISGFFNSIQQFNCTRPFELKKISRAYKVIKFQQNKSYIANYDRFDTFVSKRRHLIFRGIIDPAINYSDSQIEHYFEKFKKRQIERVEQDIGYNYN